MLTHLRDTVREFVPNETTFVRQRAVFPVTLVAGIIVALAVFSGALDAAGADTCGTPPGFPCRDSICASTCYEDYGCRGGTCERNECMCSDCCPVVWMTSCERVKCELLCRESGCPGSWCVDGLCVCGDQ